MKKGLLFALLFLALASIADAGCRGAGRVGLFHRRTASSSTTRTVRMVQVPQQAPPVQMRGTCSNGQCVR